MCLYGALKRLHVYFFLCVCVFVHVCCACVTVYGDEDVPVGPRGAV